MQSLTLLTDINNIKHKYTEHSLKTVLDFVWSNQSCKATTVNIIHKNKKFPYLKGNICWTIEKYSRQVF